MSFSVKRLLFGNWRNKTVSLIFAVSIWSVAYRAETRQATIVVAVKINPIRPQETVILSVHVREGQDVTERFENELTVVVSGPRKQIDELRNDAQEGFSVAIRVPADEEVHVFQRDELDFLSAAILVDEIRPSTVRLRQDSLKERVVSELSERVRAIDYDADFIVRAEAISPTQLRLRGPQSMVDALEVEIPVSLQYRQSTVQRSVRPLIRGSDSALVERTVEIWDERQGGWVRLSAAPTVTVRVSLEKGVVTWQADAAEVYFELPLTREAYRVVLNDVAPGGNTIPVKLTGPPEDISALRAEPRLRLLVPLPPNFDVERGGTYTFTEDSLLLRGHPGVRISQHESREKERQNAWSYEVLVPPKPEDR